MNIWEIYQYCLNLLNKDQSGRSLTIDMFNSVAQIVNIDYFRRTCGLPENYTQGTPLSPIQWQASQILTDEAKQLLVWMGGPDFPLMHMDQYGVANVPAGYAAFSSCYYNEYVEDDCETGSYKPRPIEFVPDAVWPDRLSSVIKAPTLQIPVAKWFGSKIQFSPVGMKYVNFTYLKEPATPVLAVTVDANNDYVYDPANSTQFEWPTTSLSNITNLVYQKMALNLGIIQDVQYAEIRKTKGL